MNVNVILLLAISFALLCFLLTCLCVFGRVSRWWKTALVLLSTLAYFGGYWGLRQSQGWAAAEVLPEKFMFLAVVIEEPVKDRSKGEIFLWLQPIQDQRPSGEPRAFRLPYDKNLHGLFDEASKKSRRGNAQMGTTEPRPGSNRLSWLLPSGPDTVRIRMRDLPASQLPEK